MSSLYFNHSYLSAHDHYYDGMLLRSGSHVKGSRRGLLRESSSNSSVISQNHDSPALVPTYRSENFEVEDMESHRKSGRNLRKVTTVTTVTTTDTSFDDSDDDGHRTGKSSYLKEAEEMGSSKRKTRNSMAVESESKQKSAGIYEHHLNDSELKLHLDETETEKNNASKHGRKNIRLRYLDCK